MTDPVTGKHIVSLVPSLTELVVDLGLKNDLVGRTRFCVEPEGQVEEIPIVGGTKNPDIEKISSLEPDFIIANKEENRKKDIQELSDLAEIYVSDIAAIEDALITIHELGQALSAKETASRISEQILEALDNRPDEAPLQTVYFIWCNPWMTIGRDTYIHDVMQRWNLTNVFGYTTRYPEVTSEHLEMLDPELILLSSEPFPFKDKHVNMLNEYYGKARILKVDGKWFSWYGSHMAKAFDKLNTWRKAIS